MTIENIAITAYGLYFSKNISLYSKLYHLLDTEQDGLSYTLSINGREIKISFETCIYQDDTYCFLFLDNTKTYVSNHALHQNGKKVKIPSSNNISDFQLYLDYVKEKINIDLCKELNLKPSIYLFYTAYE